MRHLRLYVALMHLNLRAGWQFPGQMLIQLVLTLVFDVITLGVLWVVLDHFGSVGGWTFWEVALLYGLKDLAQIVYASLFWTGGLDTLVIRGELDRYLVRPLNPLFHFLADHEQSAHRIPVAMTSIALIVLSSTQVPIQWTLAKVLGLTLGFSGGVLIYTGVQLLGGSIAFWTKREDTLTVLLPWTANTFLQFPLHIYGIGVMAVLTFVIPFAFINFVPVAFVIDRGSDLLFPSWIVFGTPLFGVALILIGHWVWQRGLHAYESAGT